MKIYQDIKLLWPHIRPHRRIQLIGLLGLMLVGAGAELVSLGAVVPFIAVLSDPIKATELSVIANLLELVNADVSQVAIVVSIAFALLVGLATAIRLVLLWVSNKLVFGMGFDLGLAVFSKTLNRPYSWHVCRNSSESLGGLNKAQIVVQNYLLPLFNAAVALVLAFGMVFMLIVIDPFIALVGAGAFGGCYFAMALAIRSRVADNGGIIAKANNRRLQEMQEGIGGIRDIILDSSQAVYTKRFEQVDNQMRQAQAANNFLANSPRLAIEGLGLVMIAGFAIMATRTGELNELLPVLGALGLGAQKLMPLIQMIYTGWSATTANRPSLHDVLNLLDAPEPEAVKSAVKLSKQIELKDIKYSYPSSTNKLALHDINLIILKGQVVGVVGKTGSGKSTLVDLLMGLITPREGKFLVDGVALSSEQGFRAWSLGVAHVPQSIFLADCSIMQNIALGVDESLVQRDRLEQAAKAAEIHDFICELEHGYHTEVGERGVRLSGGQRQRIGIARALYRQSQFLVLDEATSALDDSTEKAVINNIHHLFPELTIVMVAHRLSTLEQCDFIIRLDQGSITNQSSYKQIISA